MFQSKILSLLFIFTLCLTLNYTGFAGDEVEDNYPLEIDATFVGEDKLEISLLNRGEHDIIFGGLDKIVRDGELEDEQFESGKLGIF